MQLLSFQTEYSNSSRWVILDNCLLLYSLYAGNNSRIARTEANEVAELVKKEFPELSVYAFFLPPRWLCRVGDYRSIEEADAAMRRLKATGKFKEVSIVREQINIPLE